MNKILEQLITGKELSPELKVRALKIYKTNFQKHLDSTTKGRIENSYLVNNMSVYSRQLLKQQAYKMLTSYK